MAHSLPSQQISVIFSLFLSFLFFFFFGLSRSRFPFLTSDSRSIGVVCLFFFPFDLLDDIIAFSFGCVGFDFPELV